MTDKETIKAIDIASITPDEKDRDRVQGMRFKGRTFFGSGAPFECKAKCQAKLIKDPVKLVRRAKAVVEIWGTRTRTGFSRGVPKPQNVWKPFEHALYAMGFSRDQISEIMGY